MSSEKSIAISFRVSPSLKKLLEAAAAQERRSLTNMMEVALVDYCARKGILVDAQLAPTAGRTR